MAESDSDDDEDIDAPHYDMSNREAYIESLINSKSTVNKASYSAASQVPTRSYTMTNTAKINDSVHPRSNIKLMNTQDILQATQDCSDDDLSDADEEIAQMEREHQLRTASIASSKATQLQDKAIEESKGKGKAKGSDFDFYSNNLHDRTIRD